MDAGFSYSEVMNMDMVSFGAALMLVMRRSLQKTMLETMHMRLATQGSGKDWKRWVKNMEKLLKPQKKGPEEFQAAVAMGEFNRVTGRRR